MSTQVSIIPDVKPDLAMEAAQAVVPNTDVAADAQENVGDDSRPAWLPEKFKAPEDLAKAYAELEKKFSQPDKPKQIAKAEPTKAGVDFAAYSTEYTSTGDLSPESVQSLVDSGIPEPVVRNYLDGVRALGEMQTAQIHSLAGGEAQYATLLEWASESLDDAEIAAFNDTMEGGNTGAMHMAVKGLVARQAQVQGRPSKLVQGETTGPSGGIFRSVHELTEAMKDPRYSKDPAYRRDVENRLKNSSILGSSTR